MYDNPHAFELTPPPLEDMKKINDAGEFFADFIDILQAQLTERNIDENVASKMVSEIVHNLALAFSGETFYVSKKPLTFAKQMAMYNDLRHMQSSDVDKKYGVSTGYSLKIKKMIDDKRYHREQLKLF